MVDFQAIIENLIDVGFYSVILPFILVYAIVFAILEKSKIFNTSNSEDKSQTKNVNSIIAFVFGLFAVAATQTVLIMQSLIQAMVVFIIFILVVLILVGFIFGEDYMKLFKDKDGNFNRKLGYAIAGIVVIITVIVLMVITGAWDWVMDWIDGFDSNNDTLITILVIIGIGAVMYWITKGDK